MQTKNGIEFDLEKSKYVYEKGEYKFYFSSELYLKKYTQEVEKFVPFENLKIRTKYNVDINLCIFLMISLYKRIEKRGFLIKKNDKEIKDVKFKSGLI